MSNYTPKVGDRVRVTVEAVVEQIDDRIGAFYRLNGDRNKFGIWSKDAVEVEPPPEPEWQPGDVVLDAYGRTLVRVVDYYSNDGIQYEWLQDGAVGKGLTGRAVQHPLTLLVRHGKPCNTP